MHTFNGIIPLYFALFLLPTSMELFLYIYAPPLKEEGAYGNHFVCASVHPSTSSFHTITQEQFKLQLSYCTGLESLTRYKMTTLSLKMGDLDLIPKVTAIVSTS